jgi:hypothetical protein
MNKKSFWGDEDDMEPLPDWMNPKTYNQPKFKKSAKSLTECIEDALKKPHIPVDIKDPTK